MFELKGLGIAAALGSAASWALGAFLFSALTVKLNPVVLTLVKSIIGAFFLGIVLLAKGFDLGPMDGLALLALSGVIGVAIGDALFFFALKRLGPTTLVLLFALGQVMPVVMSVIWLEERPAVIQWVGMLVIVVSVSTVLWLQREPSSSSTQLAGILGGLASVFCMSVSIIMAKSALATTGAMEATFIRMLAAVLAIGLWAIVAGDLEAEAIARLKPDVLRLLTIAVLVVTFGGFWLSLVAFKYMDAAIANTLISTEPVFALLLGAVIFGTRVGRPVIVCTLSTIVGVALLSSA